MKSSLRTECRNKGFPNFSRIVQKKPLFLRRVLSRNTIYPCPCRISVPGFHMLRLRFIHVVFIISAIFVIYISGMPPTGRKHWCNVCKKSFPSYNSLGGHMNLHRVKRKQKNQARSTLSLPNIGDGPGGYGLRERRHSTWLLCDSSDD